MVLPGRKNGAEKCFFSRNILDELAFAIVGISKDGAMGGRVV